jgi:hypothetical protein
MKIRYAAAVLAGFLLLSSIMTAGLCTWLVWSSRQNMVVQAEVARLNALGGAIRALLMDSIEYSKRNPAMLPLLQSWNVLPRAAGTNQPAVRGDLKTPSK